MLIIFDLDDTLIDTTGAITPFKMEKCLERMVEAGLSLDPFSKALDVLLCINAHSHKSKESLMKFGAIYGATPEQIKAAEEELTTALPPQFPIPTTPFAKEILLELKSKYSLALVTGGHPPFQWDKLEKAGIDRSIFSMIAIPEDSVKGPHYEAIQKKFSLPSDQIWVCGDRVAMDLAPAFQLGFRTVHMRWGRGKLATREAWIDHTISDLREIKGIIQ